MSLTQQHGCFCASVESHLRDTGSRLKADVSKEQRPESDATARQEGELMIYGNSIPTRLDGKFKTDRIYSRQREQTQHDKYFCAYCIDVGAVVVVQVNDVPVFEVRYSLDR